MAYVVFDLRGEGWVIYVTCSGGYEVCERRRSGVRHRLNLTQLIPIRVVVEVYEISMI